MLPRPRSVVVGEAARLHPRRLRKRDSGEPPERRVALRRVEESGKFGERHMECAYYFALCRSLGIHRFWMVPVGADRLRRVAVAEVVRLPGTGENRNSDEFRYEKFSVAESL